MYKDLGKWSFFIAKLYRIFLNYKVVYSFQKSYLKIQVRSDGLFVDHSASLTKYVLALYCKDTDIIGVCNRSWTT